MTAQQMAEGWAREAAVRQQRGDLEGAAASYARALAVAPQWAELQAAQGRVLGALGREGESLLHLERALRLSPTCSTARDALRQALDPGGALTDDGVVEAALDRLARAADRELAGSPRARAEVAFALVRRWRSAEGWDLLRRLLRASPAAADAWFSLGLCLARHARLRGAVRAYSRALALGSTGRMRPPELARYHVCRGLARLALGDFRGGWADYEWRLVQRPPAAPRGRIAWEGEPLRGDVLFVHSEQGLGDIVLFLRFLTAARERGARIVLACPAPLRRLVEQSRLVDDVVDQGCVPRRFRRHVALASLPHVLRLTPGDVGGSPYLRVPPAEVARWRDRLGGARTLGLVWAGSPDNPLDGDRTVRLEVLRPLTGLQGWRAVSLQKGAAADEAGVAGAPAVAAVLPAAGDLLDTAALIEALDLVVGVETSVLHVAGALGRPCLAMIPYDPPWCWGARGERSPWYASVRLFRQPRPQAWGPVIDALRTAVDGRPP